MGETRNRTCALTGARILTPEREIGQGTLVMGGETVAAVGSSSEVSIPPGAQVVDCTGKIVVPGFIDLHLHGGGGFDFRDEEGLVRAARYHASHGTTSLLPTLCPDTLPRLEHRLSLLGNGYPSTGKGPLPEILGLHLEGPFLNSGRSGIFEAGSLVEPEPGMVRGLCEASRGTLRLMVLAPEIPGGMEAVEEIREAGVIPALGHSEATYEQAGQAFGRGVRHVTHLWNAMRGFHHREPGCAAAALLEPDVTVEVIADGLHLHPATLRIIHALKGADRMILVSDASPLAGLAKGRARLGGRMVEVRNGRAVDREGRLAGSLRTLGECLKEAVRGGGIPLREAVRMATENPARLLGLFPRKGSLAAGAEADVVVLTSSLEVEAVYVRGAEVAPRGARSRPGGES